jgi:flagellar M-ring protein FliF
MDGRFLTVPRVVRFRPFVEFRRWHLDQLGSSFGSFTGRLREVWSSQSQVNRMVVMALGAAIVIGLGFFTFSHFRPPTYETLFSNLSPDDANAVITKLDAQKIPHKLSADGTTVYVPADVVSDERVQLAGDGTVKGGGTGYELFDRTNLGMTDTQEKIAKVRATEGELQRTIAGLTPVESARVHIAEPDATLYSTTQEPTTASVAIRTKPGSTLSPDQVRGITQLVAGAVDGLKPDNVTIVNQDGTVLVPTASASNPDGSTTPDALKMTSDQLVAKQRYETNLQENIQGLLDASIGAKRSAVRVATDMDFDAGQTDTETYAPNGTVRSSQTEREAFVGTGGARQPPTGVPGTTTNTVPTYQGEQQNTGNSRYTKSKNTTNYEITKTTSKHIDAPGKVTRLSVAVLVNVPAQSAAIAPVGAAAAAAAPVYAVSPADVAKIRNVVAAAAGIDPTRGDVISVEAIPFAPPPETGNRVTTTTILGIPVAALIAIAVVLLLVGAGAVALSLRRRAVLATTVDLPSFDSALADELPSFEEHPMLEGSPVVAAPIRSAADLTREQMIEYVTTVAQENPDSLAKLVKLWLAE